MAESKRLVFSITIKDCEVQTFRAGGKGGQNQNKRDTGVRVIHRDSGAVAEAREHRTQLENKSAAFRRMAESKEFQTWARKQALQLRPVDDIVEEQMDERFLKVEARTNGKWIPLKEGERYEVS